MPLGLTRVGSVADAAAMVAADPGTRFLAGGTLLMRAFNQDDGAIRRLVVADGLGLGRIEISGKRVTLGAAVTMAAIARQGELAFLAPVVHSIGGPAVRNMATVGGNLFAPSPYGDLAVALLALGATVSVEGGGETLDLEAFLAARGRKPPGIVRSVAFDLPPPGAFRFAKVSRRKPHGAAVLSIAAVLPLDAGKVTGARVAYGAMAPTPVRARVVEKVLAGKALDEATIAAAAAVASEGTSPADDAFASGWYRAAVLPVHLKRLLAGKG